jgi:hypothetical protein
LPAAPPLPKGGFFIGGKIKNKNSKNYRPSLRVVIDAAALLATNERFCGRSLALLSVTLVQGVAGHRYSIVRYTSL